MAAYQPRKTKCDIPGLEHLHPLPPKPTFSRNDESYKYYKRYRQKLLVEQLKRRKFTNNSSKSWYLKSPIKLHMELVLNCALEIKNLQEMTGFIQEYLDHLKTCKTNIQISPLAASCEVAIRKRINSRHLIPLHQLEDIMQDIKTHYVETMHTFIDNYQIGFHYSRSCSSSAIESLTGLCVNYKGSKGFLNSKLHLLEKPMVKIRDITITSLSSVSLEWKCLSSVTPLSLEELLNVVNVECERMEFHLLHRWWQQLSNVIEELKNSLRKELSSLLTCIAAFIALQIKLMKERSLQNLTQLYSHSLTRTPQIKIQLRLVENEVTFLPVSEEILSSVLSIVHRINSSFEKLLSKRLRWNKKQNFPVKTSLQGFIVDAAKDKIKCQLNIQLDILESWSQTYAENCMSLLSGESENAIRELISSSLTFEELVKHYERHQDILKDVKELDDFEDFDMFSVDCSQLKEHLVYIASSMVLQLLSALFKIHQAENDIILKTFEYLKKEVAKIPQTTHEMIQMTAMLDDVQTSQVPQLQSQVENSGRHLMFLLGDYKFDHDDFTLNAMMLDYPARIMAMVEECWEVLDSSKSTFEDKIMSKVDTVTFEIDRLAVQVKNFETYGETDLLPQYIQEARLFHKKLTGVQDTIFWINKEEALFKLPASSYSEMDTVVQEFSSYFRLYLLVVKWHKSEKKWMDGSFLDLNSEVVDSEMEMFTEKAYHLQKVFRGKFKPSWGGGRSSKSDAKEELQPPLRICEYLIEKVNKFKTHLPVIAILCNPGLKLRHWQEMSVLLESDVIPNAGTTLKKMLKLPVHKHFTELEIITASASKEYSLEKSLQKMKTEWIDMCFPICQYRETGTYVLTSIEEIQNLLDDHIVRTQTMRGSPFSKPIEEQIKAWENQLSTIQNTSDAWLKVQAHWIYLEPIFSSADIMQQMPIEGKMFQNIDMTWREIMCEIASVSKVLKVAETTLLYEKFQTILKDLEVINKGLTLYLEKKRLYFPRFFFLSNDEMLEILSEIKDPLRVQPHLKKCFEGIASLEFKEDLSIHAMYSNEGEKVKFSNSISTCGLLDQVEKWLLMVQNQMTSSMRDVIEESYEAYIDTARSTWVMEWPGQVVLCVNQIIWTAMVQAAIPSGVDGLKTLHNKLQEQLSIIVALVRTNIPKQVRITLGALIVLDVHSRDVVMELIEKGISHEDDFGWLSQLRYYWRESNVYVEILHTLMKYAYEYLGNNERLVITPLTDRCYRTLMAAFHMHLNGAPEGPAGTGKTETTKDLAKALAVQCVVFNCSEGLDYLAMGKFFKGLSSSGAWACFDEFNRIELEVLSVVAQQILCISQAVRNKMERFIFEGTELNLNPNCYVCITMNPDYGGRSELPDNLKVLFRTVAMMVPDYAMIAEIILYSYGFINARTLAVKIVTVFRLCSEQLSSQWHYDYGMRAVKAVLAAAGTLKLKYPAQEEELLVLQSIIDVNLPKFLSRDIPLFEGIIADLFPDTRKMDLDKQVFIDAAVQACQQLNLQPVNSFLQKLQQAYEVMVNRHGFMLVGSTNSGKTCVLHTLSKTLGLIKEEGMEQGLLFETINPKVLNMAQLFGQFDPVSHEWTDGLVAKIFRQYVSSDKKCRKWIIFDGPVDTLWAESLNTVLDDNRKLCLMSGETIQMTPDMNIIFEVMDLSQASPATVSRCGMVYLEPSELGWEPLVQSWLTTVPEKCRKTELLLGLCNWIIPAALNFIRKNCKEWVTTSDIGLVNSLLNLTSMTLDKVNKQESGDQRHIRMWVMGAFIFGATWSIGGALDGESREKFSFFLKELLIGAVRGCPVPAAVGKIECPFPIEGLIYDYAFECKGRNQWVSWADSLHPLDDDNINIREVIVPTVDTVRYSYLMDLFFQNKRPLLFIGPTGTGKSVYVRDKLVSLSSKLCQPILLNFCANTAAAQTQDIIMSKLEKRKKGVYGPPVGKRSIIFVDDLNMPAPEVFGSHPPLEVLRQLLDHGFWYNGKDLSKISLTNIQLIAVMGPEGGARSQITPRLLRHFTVISINPFSEETMTRIFSNIMNCHLRMHTFPVDMFSAVGNIVRATLDIYNCATSYLLPTPSKAHYIFNLRDFARVIYGCCLIRRESVPNRRVFVRLWAHEVLRVFYDRLHDDQDRAWLFNTIKDCVKVHFKESFELVFAQQAEFGKVTEDSLRNLMFGNYMNPDAAPDDRIYEEITDIAAVETVVHDCLKEYNAIHKTRMDLVIFRYVLEHLSRICRVLATPGGHALLVGVGGSGRQSLTRLATFMAGYTLFQPEASRSYGTIEWREDLKRVLKATGAQDKTMVLLVTESQIKEESFLEDIDSLLNSGEISNLFAADEKQEIIESVRPLLQGSNREAEFSLLEIFNFFVKQCKKNLHIVIAFSPIGNAFYTRLHQFPSLVNCCTIDWFQAWPEEALEKVAAHVLDVIDIPFSMKASAVKLCQYFHTSVSSMAQRFHEKEGRATYVTPSSYLELLSCYKLLLRKTQKEIQEARRRYVGGLEKLAAASHQITKMQQELEDLQPQLVIAAADAKQMISKIEKESEEAERTKQTVHDDEILANQQASEAQSLKEECEHDLAEALPALESAVAALDTLKPADITVVRSMKNPPRAIKLVMAAVCVMKDIKPDRVTDSTGKKVWDYWGPSKKVLSDLTFLSKLKDYNKDNILPRIMDTIRKDYLSTPEFKPRVIAKASSAAQGLCKWVIAMEFYDRVAKAVAPKREKLAAAEEKMSATLNALASKQEELRVIENEVKLLQQKFQELSEHKQNLEIQVDLCSKKLDRAQKLIDGLAGEKQRWSREADSLQTSYSNLPGDILLASAVIAYLGPYTVPYRRECLADWIVYAKRMDAFPASSDFSLSKSLGKAEVIETWNKQGLPRDSFSIDNGIIVHNSRRWPLMIDPQSQANKWIRQMESKNGLEVVKLDDPTFFTSLKRCLQLGKPILVENVGEELDPRLDPILAQQLFKQGGIDMIQLGDFAIEYNADFHLYITTKLRNPHYLPEIATKVSLLNFMITPDGLEDQLLGIVVSKEKPELEEERQLLIDQISKNRYALKEIEDKILHTLMSSQGNILEDETAIQVLDSSKNVANDVATKQKIAEETEIQIEASRQKYQPVAKHSSALFFSLTELPNVDPMYQFSLSWFIDLFINSIHKSDKSENLKLRLQSLSEYFTYSMFCSVSRSLFQKHKLLFAFLLCCDILKYRGELDPAEFTFFLSGGVGLQSNISNPAHDWLPNQNWDQICQLDTLPFFQNLGTHIAENSDLWKNTIDTVVLPQPWESELRDFQKLLVIRCLAPNKVIPLVKEFIKKKLGERYIHPPNFNLRCSFEDSSTSTPLIFILSPGADPMASLQEFATQLKVTGKKFSCISLGQGQGPAAEAAINKAKKEGGWVVLQNCHLAVSWMPKLEKLCESLASEDLDLNFRLWLTSYPSKQFPVTVLQNGVKITNESPTGLKLNLLHSYLSYPISDVEFFNSCPGKTKIFQKLLFSLCFFHAVVQERCQYGALGWNNPYKFNESDLRITLSQLQLFLCNQRDVPYEAIEYLTGECNYGGKVTDDWDRRCLKTILKEFCNSEIVSTENYAFSDSEEYHIPELDSYEKYIQFIKALPNGQCHQVLGMHENVEIKRDLEETNQLFDALLRTQSLSSSAVTQGDALLNDAIENILVKLPESIDIEEAMTKFSTASKDSLIAVLNQELERYNRLLSVIRNSLNQLQRTLKGLEAPSPDLQNLARSLLTGRLPQLWKKHSYISNKPLASYIVDFLQRFKFFQGWCTKGKPTVFWLSGFFYMQAFLTGILQNYARRNNFAIDTLTFDYQVLPDRPVHFPETGAYVEGLFLDCAKWDANRGMLVEQEPKCLWYKMPVIWFRPSEKSKVCYSRRYSCPLYRTSERRGFLSTTGHSSNFILSVLLETDLPTEHWVKRGVALISQLDD